MNTILQLASPWGYVVVGLLAALETATLLGVFIPGETAMVLGGVLTALGHADLRTMIVVAAVCAIIGDTLGYEVGRRSGPALRRSRIGRRIPDAHWDRTERFMQRRGGAAVVLGRFIGVVRVLVPFVAGTSRMPYRRFAPFNALGATLWAVTFVTLGHLAGRSYGTVERYAGRASALVVAGIVVVAGLWFVGRWLVTQQTRVLAWFAALRQQRWVLTFERRFDRQLAFAVERLDRRHPLGLGLSVALGLAVVLVLAFSGITEDVIARNELVALDDPVSRFLAAGREPWLTTVFTLITNSARASVIVATALMVAFISRRRTGNWRAAAFLAFTMGGASASSALIKLLIARPRPASGALVAELGYAFPSGHTTSATAGFLAMALVLAGLTPSWRRRVALVLAAALLAISVGVSRIYLGVHVATDVLGGFALGGLWLVLGVLAAVLVNARDTGRR